MLYIGPSGTVDPDLLVREWLQWVDYVGQFLCLELRSNIEVRVVGVTLGHHNCQAKRASRSELIIRSIGSIYADRRHVSL